MSSLSKRLRVLALTSCAAVMLFASTASAGANRITSIDHLEVNDATNVLVRGTGTPTFTVYKLQRPARVVVDISNAKMAPKLSADGKALRQVNTWAVSQVQAHTMYRVNGSIVRVTVTMARPGTYNVKAVGHSVRVTVMPRDKAPRSYSAKANEATKSARQEAARAKRKLAALRAKTNRISATARTAEARATSARRSAAEARRTMERARKEAAAARKLIAQAKAEKSRVRRSATDARAERDKARRAMAKARAETLRAKRELARAMKDLAKANRTAADARTQAQRARVRAARIKADSKRSVAKAKADAANARRTAAASKRSVAKAEADAANARRKAAASKRSVAKAEADAANARRKAAASKRRAMRSIRAAQAEVARVRREARAAERRARVAVRASKRELTKARKSARESKRTATARLKRAESMMKLARVQLTRAQNMKSRATSAQKAARLANARADKRELAAKKAKRLAVARRTEADRARAAAERYRREALRAVDRREAAALSKRARSATRDAERRMKRATAAARIAERRRTEAEAATKIAERRRRSAMTALTAAMTQREKAEKAKRRALARKTAAIEQRRAAEALKRRAEDAAVEAQRRARRAKLLRLKEEKALRMTVVARREAVRRRAAAERAHAKIATSLRAVRRSKALVAKLLRQKRIAAKRSSRARVAELDKQRRAAMGALAAHRRDLRAQRTSARKLDKKRAVAAAELKRLRNAAGDVRSERKREEKLLAELSQRRASEERKLREARAAFLASRKTATKVAKTTKRFVRLPTRVRNVDFVDKTSAARIVIALSSPARPRIIKKGRRHAILEIANATIARRLERTLDTTKFHGPVRAVSSYRNPRDPTRVRVVVELTRSVRNKLRRVGNTYYWEFTKPRSMRRRAATTRKPNRRVAMRRPTVRTRNMPSPVVSGFGSTATPIRNSTVSQFRRKRRIYRGRKVDLDFKDVDIHDLLRSLARAGDIDFVIPDNIKEKVTIKLTRVPWDQALEVILESKGLWYRRDGRIYRIAKRDVLAAEDKAEADRLRSLANREAPEPEVFPLNYADAEQVKKQLEPLLSPKGRIEVNKRTNSLIINDIAANRRRITQLVTRLDTQTPQIQIEARIIEARSTYVREIGIQWGGNANASAPGGNATGLVFPNSVSVAGGGEDNQTPLGGVTAVPSDFAVNLPAAVGTGAGGAVGLSLGSVGGNLNLALRLSALEDQGTVRIISAPKITVINNVEATISQGVSIPISVISANGVQTQFVPADLSLKVTPKVSNDCYISLDLDIKKNEADFVNTGARGDPTILRKEAKTTLLVADGETTVLGGIYTRNTGVSYSKVPFFGDLPVVGWLFRKRRENDERTEVLVFITPKITNKSLFSASRCK